MLCCVLETKYSPIIALEFIFARATRAANTSVPYSGLRPSCSKGVQVYSVAGGMQVYSVAGGVQVYYVAGGVQVYSVTNYSTCRSCYTCNYPKTL